MAEADAPLGSAFVDVGVNLDPLLAGLQRAQDLSQSFVRTLTAGMDQLATASGRTSGAVGKAATSIGAIGQASRQASGAASGLGVASQASAQQVEVLARATQHATSGMQGLISASREAATITREVSLPSNALEMLQNRYDAAGQAALAFARQQFVLEDAFTSGQISIEEYSRLLERLKADIQGFSGAIDTAGFDRLLGIGGPNKSAFDSAEVFREAADEADRFAEKAQRLKDRLEPLRAAQARYNAELAEYSEMAKRGLLSTDQLAEAQLQAKARFDQVRASVHTTSTAMITGMTNAADASQRMVSGMSMVGNAAQSMASNVSASSTIAAASLDRVAAGMTLAGSQSQRIAHGMSLAGQAAEMGAGKAGRAVSLTTNQLANMQFQLQDIVIGLLSGQSPFLVISQQGSQIVQIFDQMNVGVLGALKAVGGGVIRFLLNPLNLIVAAGVAATAGWLIWKRVFGTTIEPMEDVLKRHESLLKDIEAAYGEAATAATDFGDRSFESISLQLEKEMETMAERLRTSFKEAMEGGFLSSGLETLGSTIQGFMRQALQFDSTEVAERFQPISDGVQNLMNMFRDENVTAAQFATELSRVIVMLDKMQLATDDEALKLMTQAIRDQLVAASGDAEALERLIAVQGRLQGGMLVFEPAMKALNDAVNEGKSRFAQLGDQLTVIEQKYAKASAASKLLTNRMIADSAVEKARAVIVQELTAAVADYVSSVDDGSEGSSKMANALRQIQVGQLNVEMEEMVALLKRAGVDQKVINALLDAYKIKLREAAGGTGNFAEAMDALRARGQTPLEEVRDELEAIDDEFREASSSASSFGDYIVAAALRAKAQLALAREQLRSFLEAGMDAAPEGSEGGAVIDMVLAREELEEIQARFAALNEAMKNGEFTTEEFRARQMALSFQLAEVTGRTTEYGAAMHALNSVNQVSIGIGLQTANTVAIIEDNFNRASQAAEFSGQAMAAAAERQRQLTEATRPLTQAMTSWLEAAQRAGEVSNSIDQSVAIQNARVLIQTFADMTAGLDRNSAEWRQAFEGLGVQLEALGVPIDQLGVKFGGVAVGVNGVRTEYETLNGAVIGVITASNQMSDVMTTDIQGIAAQIQNLIAEILGLGNTMNNLPGVITPSDDQRQSRRDARAEEDAQRQSFFDDQQRRLNAIEPTTPGARGAPVPVRQVGETEGEYQARIQQMGFSTERFGQHAATNELLASGNTEAAGQGLTSGMYMDKLVNLTIQGNDYSAQIAGTLVDVYEQVALLGESMVAVAIAMQDTFGTVKGGKVYESTIGGPHPVAMGDELELLQRRAQLKNYSGDVADSIQRRIEELEEKLGLPPGGTVGGGSIGSIGGGATLMRKGGRFKVGGSGGIDSQTVAFKASPDERVTVETPDQAEVTDALRKLGGRALEGGERPIVIQQQGAPDKELRKAVVKLSEMERQGRRGMASRDDPEVRGPKKTYDSGEKPSWRKFTNEITQNINFNEPYDPRAQRQIERDLKRQIERVS